MAIKVVDALLWPALADTVFMSTPATSCKVMVVDLLEDNPNLVEHKHEMYIDSNAVPCTNVLL